MNDLRGDDVIDSRDVIERIAALEEQSKDADDAEELEQLKALAEEAKGYSSDWKYGETLIKDEYFTEYFTEYIEELIKGCYLLPKEVESGDWPWRHITIDYEAAAEEAKQDYACVTFGSDEYWIRLC